MSAIAILLQFVFALLGFLLSVKGLFVFLLGVVLFIALPAVPMLTGKFQRFANLPLYLGATTIGRFAIVVSAHNDLLIKSMTFDDLGVERISFGGEPKAFEDPDSALHHWMGIPFALADEVHGVLFDPRHSAIGARKAASDERGETTYPATEDEWAVMRVHRWKRGVYEFAKDAHELVCLEAVRHLVDGGERAEYAERVESLYEHSRRPFQDGTSSTDLLFILVALVGPFFMMWLMASQGGGGGNGSTVSPGMLWWLVLSGFGLGGSGDDNDDNDDSDGEDDALDAVGGALGGGDKSDRDVSDEPDWRGIATVLGVTLPLPTIFLLVALFAGPLTAIFAFIVLGMGFWAVPALSALVRPAGPLAGGYARLMFKLGLMGYEQPVLEWTPQRYRLREFADLDTDGEDVTWYGLQGSVFGVTFAPGREAWGAEYIERDRLEAMREPVTDGGGSDDDDEIVDTHLPKKFDRVPGMERASRYAGFIPRRLRSGYYYIHSGIAQGRFRNSAVGERALTRLLYAKDEYGGENGLSDRSLGMVMAGCGVLSMALGVFVFFL